MNLTLDLDFSTPEPPITCSADYFAVPAQTATTLVFLERPERKPDTEVSMPLHPLTLADLPPVEGDILRIPGTQATIRVAGIQIGLDGTEGFTAGADPDEMNAGLAAYQEANGRGCSPKALEYARFAKHGRENFNPHAYAYAFVAQARHHGHTDPSLTPVRVSPAGRQEFDVLELSRFANELLRGVRSDRPAMTPERWAEASAKARETGGKP